MVFSSPVRIPLIKKEVVLSEKDFQKKVVDFATKLGYKCFHDYDSRRNAPGFPDLVLVSRYVIFAELKTDTGRLTDAQVEWIQALTAAEGVYAVVWRPSDWETIVKILTKLR